MALIPWRTKNDETGTRQLSQTGGFRNEMDQLFNSFLREAFDWSDHPTGLLGNWGPPLDVEETDKEIHVRAEVPGMKAEGSATVDQRQRAGDRR